ncbi:trehalose-phosphatase [Acidovorax sp.]|uniref:trehalose-phosphatase n=1 Tax=Acidovorax sp. TaxID=1872122 RepID=UPI00263143FB|nr:trehalose-phosphatase [Acidovorax sp.]
MQLLPTLTTANALFLDFDGTLTELAPRPEAVRVASGLVPTLLALHTHLGGALAIVTGRPESDIDGFLAPLRLPLASEHGAQYRLSDTSLPATPPPDLSHVLAAVNGLAMQHPELLIETKRASIALHYRQAQHLQALCLETIERAMQGMDGVELLRGKCVFEVKPRGVHKGQAIKDFMTQPPFAGRIPVFVGDDVTDEAGFAAVLALGGWGIKVGEGPTLAQHRCMTPAALRGWLSAARTHRERER